MSKLIKATNEKLLVISEWQELKRISVWRELKACGDAQPYNAMHEIEDNKDSSQQVND